MTTPNDAVLRRHVNASVTPTVDEGDVKVDASITDVRRQGTLADYAGELGVEQVVQITDRRNGPGQNEADGERGIWELGDVNVYDGGADGQAATLSDNTLVARQGIFVP